MLTSGFRSESSEFLALMPGVAVGDHDHAAPVPG